MPQYFSPGVYVEEVDSGPRPIQGVSTSVTGAVGATERGPERIPTLVTSFKEFQDVFGGYLEKESSEGDSTLDNSEWWRFANSVEGFFANGGQQLYVVRVAGNGSQSATLTGGSTFGLQPKTTGDWGKNLTVEIRSNSSENPTADKQEITITARVTKNGRVQNEEVFSNLKFVSTDPNDLQLFTNVINRRSKLLTASTHTDSFPTTIVPLTATGGSNGMLSTAQFIDAISLLENIEDISLVLAPGIAESSVAQKLLDHCTDMRYRFAILDAPYTADIASVQLYRAQFDSKYAAIYYPWVKVVQPGLTNPIECPSSGHVAGIYADVDTRRGVHKAPANEVFRGISSIDSVVNKRQQDILNPKGINVHRFFPGRGNRVWGARTISSDTNFKYVNVRRIFNFIERSIDEGTQFVVFEPNNAELWSRVRQTVGNFLNTQWRAGALEGATPAEAFFVACDRGTTMNQDDIENGRLICEVGIAPVYPAEFVIFRIQKYTAESKLV